MKSEKVNGFTLIELLAVIVILAIILVIAVPKILNVIEESKKDSFKNAAQLIADSAEKKKVSDKLLGKDESITCKDVAKISDEDYASCKITFDSDEIAKVSIIGKGKFDGLAIIDGTKMSSEIVELELPEYGLMKTYIENLYNDEVLRNVNNLKKDNTVDENIRYYGSDPNNYVRFNNELWRIIGVFGDNVKLIRSKSLGELSWDMSESTVNGNMGVNQWGESTYEDGSMYEGADLQMYFNKRYYGGDDSVVCYVFANSEKTSIRYSAEVCPKDENGNFQKLDETSKSLIDYHTWNTAGVELSDVYDSVTRIADPTLQYNAERGTKTGKICSGGKGCNDTVVRTTTWTGYVGLPYLSDWTYASGNKACESDVGARDSSSEFVCPKDNWMHMLKDSWFLTAYARSTVARSVGVMLDIDGYYNASYCLNSFPSIYLKSNVLIESGNGTSSNPYVLKLG